MKLLNALLSAICLAMSWVAFGAGAFASSDALLGAIKSKGAAAVTKDLWGTAAWSELIGNVEAGDAKWIDLAIALSAGSDGGATEQLSDALFVSLSRNPVHVLNALSSEPSDQRPIALSTVCVGRSDPPGTYSAAIAEMKEAEAALNAVEVKTLESKKRLCLGKVAEGESDLKRFFGSDH